MWYPVGNPVTHVATSAGAAFAALAGVGDKQSLYLLLRNGSDAAVTLVEAGTASAATGLTLAATEVAMAGPILASDLTKWGMYAAANKNVTITFLAARMSVDVRTPVSVGYEGSRDVPFVPFTWNKLVSV